MLRLLLRAYPKSFRERHGEDLLRLCRDVYGEGFSLRAAADLLWNGLRERVGAAPRDFGEWLERPAREGRGERLLSTILHDARYGVRALLASRGFTAAILVTLALGIGANTAIFSVIDAVLLRPLPYAHGDRLVHLLQPVQAGALPNTGFSPLEVKDYREQSRALDAVVEYHQMQFTLLGGAEAQRVSTAVVSANFFDAFGVRPLLGRTFLSQDDVQGAAPVLILSYEYWQRAYRADPSIVGKTFTMNDRVHQVVGVLAPMPQYPGVNDVFMPSVACPFRNGPAWSQTRTARGLTVFGRLRPGFSLAAAQKDLAQIAERLHAAYPEAYPRADGYSTTAASLRSELTSAARPTLIVLLATTLFLLVIVCANVANLTMARLVRREREMAVRTALGATRLRLLRLLLTENLILALAGGVLGVLVAAWGLDALAAFAARFTTRASEIRLDGRVLTFACSLSLFTGVLLGCLPALPSRANLAADLKEGAGATAHRARLRARSALIVSQVAVSFALLIGAGLMLRSLLNLQSVNAGFDVENVLTARVDLNWTRYRTGQQIQPFGERLLDRIRVEPGVISAALTGSVPLNDVSPNGVEFQIEGAEPSDGPRPRANLETASPDYFQTMGIPLLAGRMFTAMDREPAPGVVIVNQSFARHFFRGADAIGRRVKLDGADRWGTIVGVVADVKQHGLEREPGDELYAPFAFAPFRDLRLIVRSRAPAADVERTVRGVIKDLDPQQPVTEVKTLAQVRADNLASPRLTALLLGAFALLAIFITAAGIAGVIAYSVSQRTQEIGIRLALGADPSSVLAMVLRQGMALVGLGLALGVLGGVAISRIMSGLVFGIAAHDPVTFVLGAAVLAAVGAVACLVPARRAAGVDPMIALRSA
jgi:putative ABC transport system permease protein